jgi:Halocarboxylic acid dehydrogenase DehI
MRLRLVPETEARGRVREIYAEVKQTLGIPFVSGLFQALGAYPAFLEMFWGAVQPLLRSQEYFSLADRLRADAYTRAHNYFEIPDLRTLLADMKFSEGARLELSGVVELFYYESPIMLLLAAAQFQAFEGKVGQERPTTPAQPAQFDTPPLLLPEATAPVPVRKIYDDIKRTLALPYVNMAYSAFARWPDFLAAYWSLLKPVTEAPVYRETHYGIRDTAWAFARELPHPLELTLERLDESGIAEADLAAVVRTTELFAKMLSGEVLNVAIAKIAVEGGNRAATPQVPHVAA